MGSMARGAVGDPRISVGALETVVAVPPGTHDVGRKTIFNIQLFILMAGRAYSKRYPRRADPGFRIVHRKDRVRAVTIDTDRRIGLAAYSSLTMHPLLILSLYLLMTSSAGL